MIAKEHVDVVIPISDMCSQMLLDQGVRLGARIAGPTASAYSRASDKDHVLRLAEVCGLGIPAQHILQGRDHSELSQFGLRYPLVVKPARSVTNVGGRMERHGVHFVDSSIQLANVIRSIPDSGFPLLLQHRTVGDGIGVFLLRAGKRTIVRFGHRRLREKPPAGGVSTYRESIEPPDDLVRRCEHLLDLLEYEGAAMIEFKQDADTGDFVLMEINARFWGSLQLAIDAGIDFPSILVALACDSTSNSWQRARVGVRSYWELGELDHALAIARRSREELHLPPGTAVGLRAAWRALRDHRPSDQREVLRWDDPMPFLAELVRWPRNRS